MIKHGSGRIVTTLDYFTRKITATFKIRIRRQSRIWNARVNDRRYRGGVWTYTQELVSGLIQQGIRVTLVSLGKLPSPQQSAWIDALPELDYRPTDYRLEWMQDSERDVEESGNYLESVIREVRPDLLHLNQYCYGTVSPELPRIVVAHSDVVSWWVAVHGHEPEETPWIRWYRDTVMSGLGCADVVVAPSQWMLDALRTYYARPGFGVVVYNGRTPERFDPDR